VRKFDCVVIGGGPGGSTLSTLLVQMGWNVALLEKEVFPRFRIGESLLPFSMPIMRKTGFYERLDGGKYIRKYGASFVDGRNNKEIYFRFDGDSLESREPFAFEVDREAFDSDLLAYAKEQGVSVFQPESANDIIFEGSQVRIIGDTEEFVTPYVADATGRMALIGNKLKLRKSNPDLNNVAVFAQYKGVKRKEGREEGDIVIGVLPDQSWSWTIPFRGEITSVGVVTSASKIDKGVAGLEDFVERRLSEIPKFRERMESATKVNQVRVVSNYSHTCETIVGDRWICVGDAGMFLDPIFSSGVHLSMSGASFAANVLVQASKRTLPLNHPEFDYEGIVRKGAKRFHWIIRMFYDTDFVGAMERAMALPHMKEAFTGIVAGDVWNENNAVFKMVGL
jgi:flavin-dependent dehydrogenase